MHKVLEKRLKRIGWQHKQSLYEPVFDGYSCLAEVKKPKITVIVISWKWNPLTLKNFQELEKQRKDVRFELIFVNNGAEESDFAELKPYVNKWINLNENTGAYLARNVGAVFADGPILLFLEDDGVPADDFIKSHLYVHNNYKILSIRGVCKPFSKYDFADASHYDLGNKPCPSPCLLEGNCSHKSDLFYYIGGWDDQIKFGHGGIELSLRLFKQKPDKRLQIYHPDPVIYHDFTSNETTLKHKRKKQRIGAEYVRNKHPEFDEFLSSWRKYIYRDEFVIPNNSYIYSFKYIALLFAYSIYDINNMYLSVFRLK